MTDSAKRLLRAKVVLLGAPGVGKTSLIQRFVHSLFSETYQSTIGVKVDRKSVELSHATVAMLIWDLHGETEGLEIPSNYMRGASAGICVSDAGRPETANKAGELRKRFLELSPGGMVFPVVNKSDLDVDWTRIDSVAEHAGLANPARMSAKEDDGVDELFAQVANDLVGAQKSS